MQQVKKPVIKRDKPSPEQLVKLNAYFEHSHPDEILAWGIETYGADIVLGTGFGPSGMFLIHRLYEQDLDMSVFYLDTHLLFEETYELRDRIEQYFGLNITRVNPELTVGEQAQKYGERLWEKDPNLCCRLRKVLPLRNFLTDKKAWVTGVRRSQSSTRQDTQIVEWDPENEVVKINPLVGWTTEEVWDYIYLHELPYNPLHDHGYPSIGCIPCTQPVREEKNDERAGRWNGLEKTECGIHLPSQNFQNTIKEK